VPYAKTFDKCNHPCRIGLLISSELITGQYNVYTYPNHSAILKILFKKFDDQSLHLLKIYLIQMFEININDMAFSIKGGYFPAEKIVSQNIYIDVSISLDSDSFIAFRQLEDTIDYTVVYNITKREVGKGVVLLEALAIDIVNALKAAFDQILEVEVSVRKSPALGGLYEDVEIRYIG
jgi:dihydroneopterin aldolase